MVLLGESSIMNKKVTKILFALLFLLILRSSTVNCSNYCNSYENKSESKSIWCYFAKDFYYVVLFPMLLMSGLIVSFLYILYLPIHILFNGIDLSLSIAFIPKVLAGQGLIFLNKLRKQKRRR